MAPKKKGTKIKKEKESVGHFFLRRCNTGVADRIEEKRRFFNRQFVAIVMVSINYRFSSFKKSILRTRGGRVSFSEVFDSRSIAFMKKKMQFISNGDYQVDYRLVLVVKR